MCQPAQSIALASLKITETEKGYILALLEGPLTRLFKTSHWEWDEKSIEKF